MSDETLTARPDFAQAARGETIDLDIFANDVTAGGAELENYVYLGPGELTTGPQGFLRYTAPNDLSLIDRFVYQIREGDHVSTAAVSIDVGSNGGRPDIFVAQGDFRGSPNLVFGNNAQDLPGDFQPIDSGQRLGNEHSVGVAAGDIDGDGDLDVIVTNDPVFGRGGPGTIYLNDGEGGFTAAGSIGLRQVNFGIALGDLNGDGDLDAFIVSAQEQPNTVWMNNGSGQFTDTGQRLGNNHSVDVLLGDFDGDGDLDAFVSNGEDFGAPGDASRLYLNDSDGVFADSGQRLGNGISHGRGAVGDIDNDGDLDVVLSGQRLTLYTNLGGASGGTEGLFDPGRNLPALSNATRFVDLGDVDLDGDLDILVSNLNTSDQILLNQGGLQGGTPGEFLDSGQRLDVDSGGFSGVVALRDLDGDFYPEAIIAQSQTNFGAVGDLIYVNDGTGQFEFQGNRIPTAVVSEYAFGDFGIVPEDFEPDTGGEGDPEYPELGFLAEDVAVDPMLINGVDPSLLEGDGEHQFSLQFVDNGGTYESAVGVYTYDERGEIDNVQILVDNTAMEGLGNSFDIWPIAEGQRLGVFLVSGGARQLGDFNEVDFDFINNSQQRLGRIDDEGELLFVQTNIDESTTVLDVDILHALNTGDGDNVLNPRDGLAALSVLDKDGDLLIAFEDKRPGEGSNDHDFNDVIVRIDLPDLDTLIVTS